MLDREICEKCPYFVKYEDYKKEWMCSNTNVGWSFVIQQDADVPKDCVFRLEHIMKTQKVTTNIE